MVTVHLLNELELKDEKDQRKASQSASAPQERERSDAHLVSVPVLDTAVLSYRPEVVRPLLERDLHDAVVVRKERLVAVSKVKTPDFDVLVGRARNEELRVGRDVH